MFVVGRHDYGDPASRKLVARLRGLSVPGAEILVGGAGPKGADFLSRTYAFFPWLVAAALLLTYLVLVRAFRSLLLPLKAVLLNLLSVAAAYGLLVARLPLWRRRRPARRRALGADRGLDPDLPLRRPVRTLDGLRGVPRLADA